MSGIICQNGHQEDTWLFQSYGKFYYTKFVQCCLSEEFPTLSQLLLEPQITSNAEQATATFATEQTIAMGRELELTWRMVAK